MAGFFFKDTVEPTPVELVAKGLTAAQSVQIAKKSIEILSGVDEFTAQAIEPPMRNLVTELGLTPNQVFGILRVAVTGQKISPPLFESMELIGRQKVFERIGRTVEILEQM